MSLNETASSERIYIGFFGVRNAGKSSVVNAITNQNLSIVSEIKGTTTDPVKKAMELLPIGPVLIIDTPGLDDEGKLGLARVSKTKEILRQVDVAILIIDASTKDSDLNKEMINQFKERNIPYIVVYNKCDLLEFKKTDIKPNEIYVSAKKGYNITALKDMIGNIAKKAENKKYIVADLLTKGDIVVLVTPIDESAPKGRLILPQQLTLREILDYHCSAIVCQDDELKDVLSKLKQSPKMVITDSQAFEKVNKVVPKDVSLISFSILFARYKGNLANLLNGAKEISNLKDGDKVLISEGCTHHRQCNDIGAVQLPKLINKFTKAHLVYKFTSGMSFPDNLDKYKLIIHCGGCMINEKEMKYRIAKALEYNVPIVNYGIAISYMNGIINRCMELISKDIK